jgi:hypothetical protein
MTELENATWLAVAAHSRRGSWFRPRSPVEAAALTRIWRRRFVQRRDGKRPRAYRVAGLWRAG